MARGKKPIRRKPNTPTEPTNGLSRSGGSKEIVVNVSNRETRIALIEDGKLMEYRVERDERVVGSIFKGIVQNVLPGMDAAFVDIGLERNAFLYVADIIPDEGGHDNSPASIKRSELRRRKIKDLLKPGQQVDAEELLARMKGKIAGYKIPRHIIFTEAYPMTSSGKIRKIELRAQAKTTLG